jgi:hypothetical protein
MTLIRVLKQLLTETTAYPGWPSAAFLGRIFENVKCGSEGMLRGGIRFVAAAVSALNLIGLPKGVAAAGFAIMEQSVKGLGNAFAGSAAVAEDAATLFFNPAGMTRLRGSEIDAGGSSDHPEP